MCLAGLCTSFTLREIGKTVNYANCECSLPKLCYKDAKQCSHDAVLDLDCELRCCDDTDADGT